MSVLSYTMRAAKAKSGRHKTAEQRCKQQAQHDLGNLRHSRQIRKIVLHPSPHLMPQGVHHSPPPWGTARSQQWTLSEKMYTLSEGLVYKGALGAHNGARCQEVKERPL